MRKWLFMLVALVLAACGGPGTSQYGEPQASLTPAEIPTTLEQIFAGEPPNHGSALAATDPNTVQLGNGLTPQLVEVFSYS